MVALTQEQYQAYINIINQAGLHRLSYQTAKSLLHHPNLSIDELEAKLTARTGIDVTKIMHPKPETETNSGQDSKTEASNAQDIEITTNSGQDSKTEASNAQDIKITTNSGQDSKTEASNAQDIKITTDSGQDSKTEASNVQDIKITTDSTQNVETEASNVQDSEAVSTPLITQFFACSEKNGKPVLNNTPIATSDQLGAVEACSLWADDNDQALYIYSNNQCIKESSVALAKAACFMEILPANIIPASEQVTAIYSCSESNGMIVKNNAAFTYVYNTSQGQMQQIRDCANWVLNDGSYLAFGAGSCELVANPDLALDGCLSSLLEE